MCALATGSSMRIHIYIYEYIYVIDVREHAACYIGCLGSGTVYKHRNVYVHNVNGLIKALLAQKETIKTKKKQQTKKKKKKEAKRAKHKSSHSATIRSVVSLCW